MTENSSFEDRLRLAMEGLQKGSPVLIYHDDEDETAMVVAAEFMTLKMYQDLRKYATSEVSMMIDYDIAKEIGLEKVSNNIKASSNPKSPIAKAIQSSHAGPTLDLRENGTGSSDQSKINVMKRFAQIAKEEDWDAFAKEFLLPGHVKTYLASDGLLSKRRGHTELGVFMAKYANLSGAICMVTLRDLNDGHPLNKEESEKYAKQYEFPILYETEIMVLFEKYLHSKRKEELTSARLLKLYEKMLFIREFENKIESLFRNKEIRGSYHLSIGQEAIGVALGEAINSGDAVLTGHRAHHIGLGLGIPPKKFFNECIGRNDGLSDGKAGPMHMFSKEYNFWGANGIVGANVGIAAGVALGFKLQKKKSIAITLFGDGSTNEGSVHEALNMASLQDLPILFICENNYYSQSTRLEEHSGNVELAISTKVKYGIESYKIENGNDVVSLVDDLRKFVEMVRKKQRPIFLEIMTYRQCGHSMSDTEQTYRKRELTEKWKNLDPLTIIKKKIEDLENDGPTSENRKIEEISNLVMKEIEELQP